MSDTALGISRPAVATAEGLPQKQRVALEALCSGRTFPQAAQEAGVGRATVYRWVQSDPYFRAAYNAWQQEVVESNRARLIKLTDKAVDVIEQALKRSDEKVAAAMLRNLGVMRTRRRGSTDPDVLELQMTLRQRREQHRANEAMAKHLLGKAGLSPAEQRRYIRQHGLAVLKQQVDKKRRKALAQPADETNGPVGADTPTSTMQQAPEHPANNPLADQHIPQEDPSPRNAGRGETIGETARDLSHDSASAANP